MRAKTCISETTILQGILMFVEDTLILAAVDALTMSCAYQPAAAGIGTPIARIGLYGKSGEITVGKCPTWAGRQTLGDGAVLACIGGV